MAVPAGSLGEEIFIFVCCWACYGVGFFYFKGISLENNYWAFNNSSINWESFANMG